MQHYKDITIVTGKLATFMPDYVQEFRQNGNGFEEFSNEAILYALLEYSKFPRPFTKEERIIYVHDKCLEYEGKPHCYVSVEFDEQYGCFTIMVPQKPVSDLPF